MKTKLFILAIIFILSGCQSKVKMKVEQDGAAFAISIPRDATAAQLIEMRGIIDNTLVVKAERERMAFLLNEQRQAAHEREWYGFLFFIGVIIVFTEHHVIAHLLMKK